MLTHTPDRRMVCTDLGEYARLVREALESAPEQDKRQIGDAIRMAWEDELRAQYRKRQAA